MGTVLGIVYRSETLEDALEYQRRYGGLICHDKLHPVKDDPAEADAVFWYAYLVAFKGLDPDRYHYAVVSFA